VREQLERVLNSGQFAQAPGAARLLRFLVEEELSGRGAQLREYTLAVEVFGRATSFDPKVDPAVRVEASRLRRRLERYYLTLGRDDPVLIELPRGYRPAFALKADVLHLRRDLDETRAGRARDAAAVPLRHGPWVAVLPFECPGCEADARFGDGLTVEIVTALTRFREFHVLASESVFRHRDGRDPASLRRELGADYVVSGHVQRSDQRLRVHAQLVSAPRGEVLWAESYDRDLSTAAILEVQGEIAVRVVAALTLNPEPPDWYWFPLFNRHFERGEYDEALDMALRSQSQDFFWAHVMHAMAYQALRMHREAAAAIDRLLAVHSGFPALAREELGR
jgi:adenylate cyclase